MLRAVWSGAGSRAGRPDRGTARTYTLLITAVATTLLIIPPAYARITASLPPRSVVADRAPAYAEPTVAMALSQGRILAAGAITYESGGSPGYAVSTVSLSSRDGGSRWIERPFEVPGFNKTFDPSLAFFGPQEVAYVVGAVETGGSECPAGGSVAIRTSSDGGRTYGSAVLIEDNRGTQTFADKPSVVADPSDGTIYAVWSSSVVSSTTNPCQGVPAQAELRIARSSDGGRSFAAPTDVRVAGLPSAFGASSVVASDGTLYVAFEASERTGPLVHGGIFVIRSTDRGRTFGRPQRVSSVREPKAPAGSNIFPTSWPAVAMDGAGSVLVAWSRGVPDGASVFTSSMRPNARGFSAPARIRGGGISDIDPSFGADAFLGSLGFSDGRVRPFVSAWDGSAFVRAVPAGPWRLADGPVQVGEYIGVTEADHRVATLWPVPSAEGQPLELWISPVHARRQSGGGEPTPPPTGSPTVPPDRPSTPRSHHQTFGFRGWLSLGGTVPVLVAFALWLRRRPDTRGRHTAPPRRRL